MVTGNAAWHGRHDVCGRPNIVERRTDDPDMIERGRQRVNPAHMNRIKGRLEPDGAIESGRANDTTPRLGSQRQGNHASTDRRPGA